MCGRRGDHLTGPGERDVMVECVTRYSVMAREQVEARACTRPLLTST